jgi:hypothetical protein
MPLPARPESKHRKRTVESAGDPDVTADVLRPETRRPTPPVSLAGFADLASNFEQIAAASICFVVKRLLVRGLFQKLLGLLQHPQGFVAS